MFHSCGWIWSVGVSVGGTVSGGAGAAAALPVNLPRCAAGWTEMSKCVTSGFVNVVISAFHLQSKEPHGGVGSSLIYVLASDKPSKFGRENSMICLIYFN